MFNFNSSTRHQEVTSKVRTYSTYSSLALLTIIAIVPFITHADVSSPASYGQSSSITDWITKSICVDSSGHPVEADPYYNCPSGTTRRKIQPGDRLPYHNVNALKNTQSDSVPLLDAQGNPLYVHTTDRLPFDTFSQSLGSDGYDSISLVNGWATFDGTQDAAGFHTHFFSDCATSRYGLRLFPISGFLSGGLTTFQQQNGAYYQLMGYSYPGPCPSGWDSADINWALWSAEPFGGTRGLPSKTMDTLVSIVGFSENSWGKGNSNASKWLDGHLEAHFFTQQYGWTRWEVWIPIEQLYGKTPLLRTDDCSFSSRFTPLSYTGKTQDSNGSTITKTVYTIAVNGHTFYVDNCEDASNVTLSDTASAQDVPEWPLPQANLLAHAGFRPYNDSDKTPIFSDTDSNPLVWHRAGNSSDGHIINWGVLYAKGGPDSGAAVGLQSGKGLPYLSINCGNGANATCGVKARPIIYQSVFQDIPMTNFVNNGTYLFGVNVRMDNSSQGTLDVVMQEMDVNGNVLWQDQVEDSTITWDNGTKLPGYQQWSAGEIPSMYLSSEFLHKVTMVPVKPGAVKMRFSILPYTEGTFDILDAWVNRFPAAGVSVVTPPAPVMTTIRANNTATLSTDSTNYFLSTNSSSPVKLSYNGSPVTIGQFSCWTPIGAAFLDGNYYVAWKCSNGTYTVWKVSSSGANIAGYGNYNSSDSQLKEFEGAFGQDLNGDGVIGMPAQTVQNGTTFVRKGLNYYLYANGTTNGPELMYQGAPVVIGQFGSWVPILGVARSGGGYFVLWQDQSRNMYTVWNVSSTGANEGGYGDLKPTDSKLMEFEPIFNFDINGDGKMGPTSAMSDDAIRANLANVLTAIQSILSQFKK